MNKDVINIVIRVMPKGDELDVELPLFTTAKEIIEELIRANVVPRTDPGGNYYSFELISKINNSIILEKQTLHDIGIKEGDVLYFVPKIIAGGGSKYDQLITLNINVMPIGIKLEIETPPSSTGLIIKEQVFSKLNLNIHDYDSINLFLSRNAKEVSDKQELSDLNIQNNELIILTYHKQNINQNKEAELSNFNNELLTLLGLQPDISLNEILLEVKRIVEIAQVKQEIKIMVDKWIQELAKAETNKVLNEALKFCRQNKLNGFVNQLLNQSSRWHTLHKQTIEGVISHDNFMLELNKVNTATVSILFEMEEA